MPSPAPTRPRFSSAGWARRRWEWRLPVYAVTGTVVGLLVHPHFPKNLEIWVLQTFEYFRYRAVLDKGMTENEMVHCFGGFYVGEVRPDPSEAEDHSWTHIDKLRREVDEHPERYSAWFCIYLRDHWVELTGSA